MAHVFGGGKICSILHSWCVYVIFPFTLNEHDDTYSYPVTLRIKLANDQYALLHIIMKMR